MGAHTNHLIDGPGPDAACITPSKSINRTLAATNLKSMHCNHATLAAFFDRTGHLHGNVLRHLLSTMRHGARGAKLSPAPKTAEGFGCGLCREATKKRHRVLELARSICRRYRIAVQFAIGQVMLWSLGDTMRPRGYRSLD